MQQRMGLWTNKYVIFMMVCWGCIVSPWAQAQTFDQNFQEWKAKQQMYDRKLNIHTPSVHSSQSYTSKKSLSLQSSGEQIRLNQADASTLQQLNGIGEKKAQAIVEYRQKNGGFKSIDEIKNVKGIGPALFEKNKARLAL